MVRQGFRQAVLGTVAAMTPTPPQAVGAVVDRASQLTAQLPTALEFPADRLVEALALARVVAASSATHPPTPAAAQDLLAGLHLDLADVELSDAYGLAPPDPVVVPAAPVDAAAQRAMLELLATCAGTIASHLEHHRDDLAAEQLLASSRAVLHIDAARRCWLTTFQPARLP